MDGTDDVKTRWKELVSRAKKFSSEGKHQRSLDLFREAFDLIPSDKLQKRINNIELYIKENADDDDSVDEEDGEEMVHVGDGFYLNATLYNKLYSHQRQGVLFLYGLFKKKKGGVLGDDMGLGKTIQVIALLSGLFDAGKVKSVLVVCPVAVICNWEKELERWAPGIVVHEFHSESKQKREAALRQLRRHGGICLTSYGIVVTNAETLAEENGRDFFWDYVILDEGHKIKNTATRSSKAVHSIRARNRLVLSGTPIMNNLKEMWALFDWVHAGKLLGTAKTFGMEYEQPIMTARQKDATAGQQRLGHEMSQSLSALIQPYFLRRTKGDVGITEAAAAARGGTGNTPGKAPKMPTLTRKNDLVIWLCLSDIQKDIYSRFIDLPEIKALLNDTKSPLVGLTVLKKICDHPRLMTNKQCLELGLEMPDGVDFDTLDAQVAADPTLFDVSHISDALLMAESCKIVFLVELMENLRAEKHRCLVFSSSRRMIDIVQKLMKNRGHKMCRLDGTVRSKETREEIIDRFMSDKSFTSFLLTTQVGGIGLTLTAADRVIVIDPSWNPATDSQAVDRAFRIGQDKDVVVYRLITCGTIEEKIYRRQVFKDSVMRQTTGDTKNPFRYFTKQDLKELFILDDTRRSDTQVQLAELHRGLRRSDTTLDAHIAYLHSLDIFGVSDHDLMFVVEAAKIVEGEGDMEEMGDQFVMQRVTEAQEKLVKESLENEMFAEQHGKYQPKTDSRWGGFSQKDKVKADNNATAGPSASAGAAGPSATAQKRPPKDSKRINNMFINDDDDDSSAKHSSARPSFLPPPTVISSSDEEETARSTAAGRSSRHRVLVSDDDDDDRSNDRKTKPALAANNFALTSDHLDDSISHLQLSDKKRETGAWVQNVNSLSSEDDNRSRSHYDTAATSFNNTTTSFNNTVNDLFDRSPARPTPYAVQQERLIFSPRMDRPLVACAAATDDPDKTATYDLEKTMPAEELEDREEDDEVAGRKRRRSAYAPRRADAGLDSDDEDHVVNDSSHVSSDDDAEHTMENVSGRHRGDDDDAMEENDDLALEESIAVTNTTMDVTDTESQLSFTPWLNIPKSAAAATSTPVVPGNVGKMDLQQDDDDGDQDEDDTDEEKERRWSELMIQCKQLYKQGKLAESFKCGTMATQLYNGNPKANQYVAKVGDELSKAGMQPDTSRDSARKKPSTDRKSLPRVDGPPRVDVQPLVDSTNMPSDHRRATLATTSSSSSKPPEPARRLSQVGGAGKASENLAPPDNRAKQMLMSGVQRAHKVLLSDGSCEEERTAAPDDSIWSESQGAARQPMEDDDSGEDEEEEDDDDITAEQEAQFLKLLANCKTLRMEHRYPEALKAVEAAIRIFPHEPRVLALRDKIRQKLGLLPS